jgi:ribonuclease P protein component
VRSPLLNLKFSHRDPHKPYRVAVIVSRKVSKSAVTRNRIRRRIYEIVRQSPPPKPGTDLVFTVFSPVTADMEADQLRKLVENLLTQAAG